MDYRVGEVKNLKTRLIDLINLVIGTPVLIAIVIVIAVFTSLIYWISGHSVGDTVLKILFGAFLGMLLSIYSEEIKLRLKIRALKPSILLELKYILISLIENFSRFYVVYFEFLKFDDLSRLFELIEKRKKDFPNYLIDEMRPCMILYESYHKIYQENIKKITLEVKKKIAKKSNQEDIKRMIEKSKEKTSWQDTLNYFHSLLETYKENKPSIKPIHMTLLSSILNNLSAFDKDFAEDIFYIWYEISELNRETEVLKELSRTDRNLILSISKRTERIAIKIDEILEKERTNL
jgi:hypothetical protein